MSVRLTPSLNPCARLTTWVAPSVTTSESMRHALDDVAEPVAHVGSWSSAGRCRPRPLPGLRYFNTFFGSAFWPNEPKKARGIRRLVFWHLGLPRFPEGAAFA